MSVLILHTSFWDLTPVSILYAMQEVTPINSTSWQELKSHPCCSTSSSPLCIKYKHKCPNIRLVARQLAWFSVTVYLLFHGVDSVRLQLQQQRCLPVPPRAERVSTCLSSRYKHVALCSRPGCFSQSLTQYYPLWGQKSKTQWEQTGRGKRWIIMFPHLMLLGAVVQGFRS